MKTDRRKNIDELFRRGDPIDRAVRMATRDALLLHKRMERPVPVWRDGRTVWIPPEEIEVPPEEPLDS